MFYFDHSSDLICEPWSGVIGHGISAVTLHVGFEVFDGCSMRVFFEDFGVPKGVVWVICIEGVVFGGDLLALVGHGGFVTQYA